MALGRGADMQLVGKGRTWEFTWQLGSLASQLVVSTVAVQRQQAADNLQETNKLDMYTKRWHQVLATLTKIVAWDLVRNVHLETSRLSMFSLGMGFPWLMSIEKTDFSLIK